METKIQEQRIAEACGSINSVIDEAFRTHMPIEEGTTLQPTICGDARFYAQHGDDHHDAPFELRCFGVMGVHGSISIMLTETYLNGQKGYIARSELPRLSMAIEKAHHGLAMAPKP
jgi:hypothetical protein